MVTSVPPLILGISQPAITGGKCNQSIDFICKLHLCYLHLVIEKRVTREDLTDVSFMVAWKCPKIAPAEI